MTVAVFHRHRNLKRRNLYLRRQKTKRAIKHTWDRDRFPTPFIQPSRNFMPVKLDQQTLRWMKAKFESSILGKQSLTWMELSNAWIGCNHLRDIYADGSTQKQYCFVHALNLLQQQTDAARKTVSNWDEAVEFIALEMSLPDNDKGESGHDGFIQRLESIQIDHGVGGRFSQSLWRMVSSRIFTIPVEDDDKDLQERIEKIEQADAERRVIESEAEYQIIPVSDEDCQHIQDVMHGGSEEDIVAQVEADTVQRRSLATLLPGQWLNDEVIHAYMQLLSCEKQHFFRSFFITMLRNENVPGKYGQYQYSNVKRWSKKVKGMGIFFPPIYSHKKTSGRDVFAMDKIFFPVNQGNAHWTLAVAFVQERRIQFYDSMGGSGRAYLEDLARYFQDEHKDKKRAEDTRQWTLVPCTPDTPRQRNVVDCGVFICMFSEFLSRERPLTFSQDDIYNCRNRMAHSLLTGKLAE